MSLPNNAIVRSSALVAANRLDADFHIALNRLRDVAGDFRTRYSEDAAIALLAALPLSSKTALHVLRRGQVTGAITSRQADAVARDYPHLSLALLAEGAKAIIPTLEAVIDQSREEVTSLEQLSADFTAFSAERAEPGR